MGPLSDAGAICGVEPVGIIQRAYGGSMASCGISGMGCTGSDGNALYGLLRGCRRPLIMEGCKCENGSGPLVM
jgi:hypothetical protein